MKNLFFLVVFTAASLAWSPSKFAKLIVWLPYGTADKHLFIDGKDAGSVPLLPKGDKDGKPLTVEIADGDHVLELKDPHNKTVNKGSVIVRKKRPGQLIKTNWTYEGCKILVVF